MAGRARSLPSRSARGCASLPAGPRRPLPVRQPVPPGRARVGRLSTSEAGSRQRPPTEPERCPRSGVPAASTWHSGLRVACRPDAEVQPEAPEEPGSRTGPPLPSVSQLPPPPRPWGSAVGRSTLDCAADRRPRRSGGGSEGVGGGAAAAREPSVERGALSVRACR